MSDKTDSLDDASGAVDAIVTGIYVNLLDHTIPGQDDQKVIPADATVEFDGGKSAVTVPVETAKKLVVGQLISVPRKPQPDYESWARSKAINPYG